MFLYGFTDFITRAVLFVVLFIYLKDGTLAPVTLLVGTSLVCGPLYLLYIAVQRGTLSQIVSDLRRAAIFVAFGFSLAPVMKTLTETISTDTIYAMAAGMLLLHLVTHDYSKEPRAPDEDDQLPPDE